MESAKEGEGGGHNLSGQMLLTDHDTSGFLDDPLSTAVYDHHNFWDKV